jgi:prepilin-type processing-associated H-X9-DG protein
MALVLSLPLCLAFCGPIAAASPESLSRDIAPFLGAEIAVVAHFDLMRLDVASLTPRILAGFDTTGDVTEFSRRGARWVVSLRQAGAKDLFLLANPADIPGPPAAVIPIVEGTDPTALGQILSGRAKYDTPFAWPTCATLHHAVFAGTPEALERARRPIETPRPELSVAFAALGNAPAQILISPTADQRRVFEELVPTLPLELGGGPITILTRGMSWAAIGLKIEPKPELRLIVQTRDAASAQALVKFGKSGLTRIRPDVRNLIAPPDIDDNRITTSVNLEIADSLIYRSLHTTFADKRRGNCANNLKSVVLALGNYRIVHNTFPPAFNRDKEGRPLLSWRVHVLPYIDQQTLYNEFHLDEPWDSPHNKALIEKMPAVFACPSERRENRRSGKTTYVVPRGKSTVFPDGQAVKWSDITDQVSNTIVVVDVSDARAVIWTEPEDWEVDPEPNKDDLFGHHDEKTTVAFADGSVRFLDNTISLTALRALLSRNGKEVINPNEP